MSIYLKISTSCSLTPYYSLELEEISSTSHSGISRVAIHMICCVSRAKILNYDAPDGRRRTLTSLFLIFDIFVIFQYFSLFFNILMYFFRFSIEFPARGWSQTAWILKILKNRFSCTMNTPCEKFDIYVETMAERSFHDFEGI